MNSDENEGKYNKKRGSGSGTRKIIKKQPLKKRTT